ncbi:uncharacterized protein ppp1r3aa isoform X2 [Danio aesculapii]|uniref:uncharacterized protein ppp1r3aa isoform X2 n=1 Tax=Danio aesculapii TaxID=1142201 RepID=UPI0024BFCF98|nr:uncharacterized protein ppp1r3aa isoform X2 [Danio aesculapii]
MSMEDTTCNLEPPNNKDWIMKNQEDKMEQVAEDESEDDEPESPPIAVRRKVSFADAFGLDLVLVKEYDDRDSSEGGEYYISCLFTIADLNQDMEVKLQQQKLELERFELLPGSTTIRGIIRVLNLCFHKSVFVRVTLDGWQSHFELMAEYVPGSSDGQTDCFCFHLDLTPPFPVEGLRVEFCLRYESAVGTFWASNGGTNYIVFCYQRRRSNFKEHPREDEKEIEKEKVEDNLHKGIRSCLKANRNYTEATPEKSGEISEQVTPNVGRNRNKTKEEAGSASCKSLKDCCKTLVDRRRKRQAARLAHVQKYFSQKATETQMGCNSNTDESSTSIPRLSIQSRTDNQHGFGMDTPPILIYHQIPLLSLDWGSTSTIPLHANPLNTDSEKSQQVEDHQAELSFDAFLKGSDMASTHSYMQDQAWASPESLDQCEVSASRDKVRGLEDRGAEEKYSQESGDRRAINIIKSDPTEQEKDLSRSLSSDQVVDYQLVKEPRFTTLPCSALDSRDQIVVPMEGRGAEKDYSQGSDDRRAIEMIKSDPTEQGKEVSTSLFSDQVVDYQLVKEPRLTTVPCSVFASRDQIVVPMEDRGAKKDYSQRPDDKRAIEIIKSEPTEQRKDLSMSLSRDQVVDVQLAKEPMVTAVSCSVVVSRDKDLVLMEDRGAKKGCIQESGDRRAIDTIKCDPTEQGKDLSMSLSSDQAVNYQLVKEPRFTTIPCSVLDSRDQTVVPVEELGAEKNYSQWSADRRAIKIIKSEPTEQRKDLSMSLSSDQVVDYQLVKKPRVTTIPCSVLGSEPDRLERELEASRDCRTPHHELTSGFLSQDMTKASPGDETRIAHDTETRNSEAGDGILPEDCTGSSDTSKVKENTHRMVKDILTFTGIRDVPLTNRQAEGSSSKRKDINIDDSEKQVEMSRFYTELHEEDAESSRKGQDETTMDHSAEIQSVSSCESKAFNENELCTLNKNLHKDNSELQKSEERRFEANEGLKIKERLNEATIEAAKGGEEDEMCSESKRELIEDPRFMGNNCTDEDLTSIVTYLTDSTDPTKHIPQTTSIKDREVNSQDEDFELGKSLNGSSNRLFSWWQEFNSLGHRAKALLYAILFVIFITTYLCDMPTCLALYLFSLCWWCSQGMKQRLDGASVDVD